MMRCTLVRTSSAVVVAAFLLGAGSPPAFGQPGQFLKWTDTARGRPPAGACGHLRSLSGYDFAIDAATEVPAQGEVPGFCLVQGLIAPEIRFEVGLPSNWNERLYMFGNGGFAGEPFSGGRANTRNQAIRRGFVTAATNTGHDASSEPLATFASNPQKLTDYAYRAVHVTAMTAKTIARAYFDAPVSKSYFVGCSTGGRQGLISAQRFPDDFDGIVVGAPVLDFTGTMMHFAAINRALAAAPVSLDRVALIADKVAAKCDALDGVADGVLEDPRQCPFDVAKDVPICTPGGDPAACLTEPQVKALQTVYGGVSARGRTVMPGFPVGAEARVPSPAGLRSGWHPWIIAEGQQTVALQFSDSFFKEMATPGTPIDWRTFDAERDIDRLASISALLDATDPDLSRFRKRGGKILMWFGWADPALNPMMGVHYYERMRQTMGGGTEDFFRLFMLPGVLHCAGGLGPGEFDSITPLVEWVERDAAPDRLIATLRQGGKAVRSRPLCPYPMVAEFNGTGNKDDEVSFRCAVEK
jgi:feruloyl esterase